MKAAAWVIVTGISGSGRTTALRALEDAGYFCVDNLPASLLPALHGKMAGRRDERRVAVGIDVRAGAYLDDFEAALAELQKRGVVVRLLFLDCADDVLVRRFAETRRRHPVPQADTIVEAIRRERAQMLRIRERTTLVVDTSELNIHELKARIQGLFGDPDDTKLVVSVMSFGFKHGLPRGADYVFDVRFLDNPHFVDALRPHTGLDPQVSAYVLNRSGGAAFLDLLVNLLSATLPQHLREGRALVTVAIGCTGGQHRSVAMTEALADRLRDLQGCRVARSHRDVVRMSSS